MRQAILLFPVFLLFPQIAVGDTVKYEFSGRKGNGHEFSGWVSWDTGADALKTDLNPDSNNGLYQSTSSSFISWYLVIESELGFPVDDDAKSSIWTKDLISVDDDVVEHVAVESYFGAGSSAGKFRVYLTYPSNSLSGDGVPLDLTETSLSEPDPGLAAKIYYHDGQSIRVSHYADSFTLSAPAVPLPPAGFAGLGLLGLLAVLRRRRRRRQA